ncbi:hypothetical protein KCP91_12030 [Microvirga sp. SRT01]|uniref:Uncharacterized protein n=1 Tax=Sphingomonas longa TaxID=2778730 RepID=A0ABS2D848_9SPHN|nr:MULTISPECIES: hypothetical protein [Alphaproteobacteria]MBM6577101.1 hypothetical protein [Sphingomonas sp. BT552]MBR7710145.1 hypothetical protein [Microvirga sp. SRT01]
MANAIHFKNDREGLALRGQTQIAGKPNGYRSCCWLLTEADQKALIGGWLYLHPSKSQGATHGGRIIGFEPAIRETSAIQDGVAILYIADVAARGVKWRGASHGMAYTSGIVTAGLSHEAD